MKKIIVALLVVTILSTGCATFNEQGEEDLSLVTQVVVEEAIDIKKAEEMIISEVDVIIEEALDKAPEEGLAEEISDEPTTEETPTEEIPIEEIPTEEQDIEELDSEETPIDGTPKEEILPKEEIEDGATGEEQSPEDKGDPVSDDPVIGAEIPLISIPSVNQPLVTGTATRVDEVRAVWLSYIDLKPMFASESNYRNEIEQVMKNLDSLGMNTVMYQVRPFADAFYRSSLFPSSHVISGVEGIPLSYDPLEIAIDMAHQYDIRLEAWINPYRIRSADSKVALADNSIAKTWYEDGSRRVLKTQEGILIFNPADASVRDYITSGVEEIIDYYEVDGIHFDDYFYPTQDMAFDEIDYLAYSYDEDTLSRDGFRRKNVNLLIKQVYELVHSYNRNIVFGISPQGVIATNYNQLYVDIPLWLSENGYIDYICPQVYYGFEHAKTPFDKTLDEWNTLIKNDVDLIAGIAVYKIGRVDQWAGTGKEEWLTGEDIVSRMITAARGDSHYGGYALYRYDYLFKSETMIENRMMTEIEAIKALK